MSTGNRVLPLGGIKQRGVLALLLLERNRVVSARQARRRAVGRRAAGLGREQRAGLRLQASAASRRGRRRDEHAGDGASRLRPAHLAGRSRRRGVRAAHDGGSGRPSLGVVRRGRGDARSCARDLARACARRPRNRAVRTAGDRPARGTAAGGARGALRSDARRRAPGRGSRRATGARRPAPARRAAPRHSSCWRSTARAGRPTRSSRIGCSGRSSTRSSGSSRVPSCAISSRRSSARTCH